MCLLLKETKDPETRGNKNNFRAGNRIILWEVGEYNIANGEKAFHHWSEKGKMNEGEILELKGDVWNNNSTVGSIVKGEEGPLRASPDHWAQNGQSSTILTLNRTGDKQCLGDLSDNTARFSFYTPRALVDRRERPAQKTYLKTLKLNPSPRSWNTKGHKPM